MKAGSERERATFGPKALFVSRAEDFLATALPDEVLHEPIVEAAVPQPLAFEGLFAPRDAVALLRLATAIPMPSDRIDVARVTDDLARARPLLILPRLRVPSLAFGALLLVDVGQPMQPFWEDQQEFVDRFRRALRGLADVRFIGDDPLAGAGRDRRKGSWTSFELPRPGTPVIALSDLGCGFPPRPETARAWLALAGQLRRRQCRVVAFAPVRPARVVPALRRAMTVAIGIGRPAGATSRGSRGSPMADDRLIESEILVDSYGADSALVALAELASPACRIEPQLLRRLRLACLPEADVSIEQELWQSELINARGKTITFRQGVARVLRGRLRARRQAQPHMVGQARAVMTAVHAQLSPLLILEDELAWAEVFQDDASIRDGAETLLGSLLARRDGLDYWLGRAWNVLPASLKQLPEGRQLAQAAAAKGARIDQDPARRRRWHRWPMCSRSCRCP